MTTYVVVKQRRRASVWNDWKYGYMTTQWMPQIDRRKCTGCGECVARCPTKALGRVEGKAMLVHPDLCTYCTACEDVCPTGAIELPFLIMSYYSDEEIQNAKTI